MRLSMAPWLVVACVACGTPAPQGTTPSTGNPPPGSAQSATPGAAASAATARAIAPGSREPNLDFVVRAGKYAEPAPERARQVTGTPVSDAEADVLLRTLPALPKDAALDTSFAKREASAPPPTAVTQIKDVFGASTAIAPKPKPAKVPVEIVRMSPEGEVDFAPEMTITFNQPMIAITSHAESVSDVPAKLTPTPPGRYRWLGTRSLVFTPTARFPMATEYTVEIPAGTRSADGSTLGKAAVQRFRTPAPKIEEIVPQDSQAPQSRTPVVAARFDQAIQRDKLIAQARFCHKQRCIAAREANASEISKSDEARNVLDRARTEGVENRTVALVPVEPLDGDAQIALNLGRIPSAEGPRLGDAVNTRFRTHGPLKILGSHCGYGTCTPYDAWYVSLSNPLDASSLDLAKFQVDPAVRLTGVAPSYGERGMTEIAISAEPRPRTTYTLTVPAGVRDIFGQVLSKPASFKFAVGDPQSSLDEMQLLTVLDPRGPRSLSVRSTGVDQLRVQIYRVAPENWNAFTKLQELRREDQPSHLPGKRVVDTTVRVADPSVATSTRVDVTAALDAALGHAIVLVEPVKWPDQYKPRVLTWVESTQLAVDGFFDRETAYGWVTRLADAKPVAGASLSIWPETAETRTDAHGLARLTFPERDENLGRLLIAKSGKDVAFFPERFYEGGQVSGWRKQAAPGETLRWFVFDDRGAYRPGEKANLKGWIRATQGGEGGNLVYAPGLSQVSYEVTSSRGQKIAEGQAKVSAVGGFDLTFALPKTVDLGHASIHLTGQGSNSGETWHAIRVEEFRRPEYEVSVKARASTHFAGDVIAVDAKAAYYTGGPLAGARTTFTISAQRADFSPPHRGDYGFGEPMPWFAFMERRHFGGIHGGAPVRSETFMSQTDAAGVAALEVATKSATPAYAHTLTVTASIQDVNRQAWSDQAALLVHPGDVYVGLKSERWFVAQGEPLTVNVVAVDLDGKDVKGRPVVVRASRFAMETSEGESVEREHDVQTCNFASDGTAHLCTFQPHEAGQYRVVARVVDAKGRPNDTTRTAWVTGPVTSSAILVGAQEVQLMPNKSEYQAGEQAEILVQAPFFPAEAIVRHARDGMKVIEHVRIEGPTHLIRVPVSDDQAPSLHVSVSVAGMRSLESNPTQKIPAFAEGTVELKIALGSRALKVEVRPQADALEPGTRTGIDVTLRDSAGAPVADGEVALAVVDEAVLALTGYKPGDPLEAFYPAVGANVWNVDLRQYVLVDEPKAVAPPSLTLAAGGAVSDAMRPQAAPAPERMEMKSARVAGKAASNGPAPTLRKDFSPIALFAPRVITNKQGIAHVDFALPDDLTRYRIFALAASGPKRFGHGEATLTARKVLMVRPSAPRFLNFGDQFELPIVLENQSNTTLSVLVAARASNLTFSAGRGRRVEVPAHDRLEVRLPMATRAAGTAQIQVAGQAKQASDAAQIELPIWTPATDEAFATYGSIVDNQAVAQPIAVPSDVYTEFGGLDVSTSSTQLASLTDSVLYMVDYPFECSEQLASRMLTLLALRDVLEAFKVAGIPNKDAAQNILAASAKRLLDMQNGDGGFATWQRGNETIPFHTVHALHALLRAREAGISGLDEAIERAHAILPTLPDRYTAEPALRRSLASYALYVESLFGTDVRERAASLWRETKPGEMPIEAMGWLLSAVSRVDARGTLATALVSSLQNRSNETASTAQFTERYTDTNHVLLHSDQRSDAIALEGMMRSVPDHDLVPKIAKGLLAHRSHGRWNNTQENVFSALALRAYFDHYEKETPSFEARTFVGNVLAQAASFRGRSTDQHTTSVPMKWLAAQKPGPVVLQKVGQGRMYYRLGLHYAPKRLDQIAEDQGFEISRTYEGLDDPRDVTRDDRGVWTLRAGARIRVNVEMVTKARRYHVALVDPLAAGVEPIQTSLRVNAQPPAQDSPNCPNCKRFWWWSWHEHDNLRDERAEAFSSLLPAGVYTYSYLVRATTPGQFVVPPAKAEEMYMPETFGRSGTDRVVIR